MNPSLLLHGSPPAGGLRRTLVRSDVNAAKQRLAY